MFYLFAFYSTFSVYFILPDFLILFSTFSGTHVRMCVQVATPWGLRSHDCDFENRYTKSCSQVDPLPLSDLRVRFVGPPRRHIDKNKHEFGPVRPTIA